MKLYKKWLLRNFSTRISSKRATQKDAIFVKVGVGDHLFTCLAETDKIETYEKIVKHIMSIEKRLNLVGIEIIALEILPLQKIPFFPFITTIDKFQSEIGKELGNRYFERFDEDSDAIKSWYRDLVKFRREIIRNKLNKLILAIPHVMKPQNVLILYYPEGKMVKMRFYLSEEDKVELKEVDEVPNDETFKEFFELPSPRLWTIEITRGTSKDRRIHEGWAHPYIAAALELKQKVKEFNREQRTSGYDAEIVTESTVRRWISQEIKEIRELVSKFPLAKEKYLDWMQPIFNLTLFSKDSPDPGRLQSGMIKSYYYRGTEDRIKSLEFLPATSQRIDELIREEFPELESNAKPFFSFASDLLFYLRDKMGEF
ncbi:MAG: hypothetical protein ACFFBS_03920 [Promethearchaeota archaeon]